MRKLVSLILFALVSANCVAQDTIWHKTVSSDKAAVQRFLNQGVSIEAKFNGNGGTPTGDGAVPRL